MKPGEFAKVSTSKPIGGDWSPKAEVRVTRALNPPDVFSISGDISHMDGWSMILTLDEAYEFLDVIVGVIDAIEEDADV